MKPSVHQRNAARTLVVLLAATFAHAAQATQLYFNGFETDTAGWFSPTRVASGTGGITSSSGAYHATPARVGGDYTTWGGYNFGAGNAVPTVFQEYWTSIDIYLDVAGGWANNTRFDFSSAINNSGGTHRRDFIFNAGFYNDADGSPGSGNSRFVISASNNSQPGSAYAKNPDKGPIAILTSGWYTFEHHFYNNSGVLAVDMSILDSANAVVNSWTLSDPSDLIAGIGGNRYGWFAYNQFGTLAFDNSELRIRTQAVPEVGSTLLLLGFAAALSLAGLSSRRLLSAGR